MSETTSPAPITTSRREEQLEKLLDVARYMAVEKDLDRLLIFISNQVTVGLGCERCGIFIADHERREIWSKVVLGEEDEIRFPMGAGIAGHVITTGKAELIKDAYNEPRFNKEIDLKTGFRTRDILCVPMTSVSGQVIGCFQVINKISGTFGEGDLAFLEAFGSQAAVAVESTQLISQKEDVIDDLTATQAELRSKMAQLEVIYELERAASSSLDDDNFMEHAVQNAVKALDGTAGSILILDDTEGRLRYTFESDAGKVGPLEEGEAARHVLETGESFLGDDASLLAVPLFMQSLDGSSPRIAGVTQVLSEERGSRRFSRDDLSFLETICGKISSMLARLALMNEKAKSERLATIGQLTDTIIHDFKNPMAIIKGMAEIMQTSDLPAEKRARFCQTIVSQVERCTNMTREILDFTTGSKSLDTTTVNIGSFLDEILSVLEFEAERHKVQVHSQISFRGDLKIDGDRIKRVIFNLTNNAFEVMKNGGSLTITSAEVQDEVELSVADSGPGVPEPFRKKLFQAFATQGKKGGTGLGLHISKEICEAHGGAIYLDESATQGARFVIRLPKK